jgi:hypothetical protein
MRGPFKTDGKLDEFASSLLGQRTKNLLDSKPGGAFVMSGLWLN